MTDERDPLIITATPNICWLEPSVGYPGDAEEMAAEAVRCGEAGAHDTAHARGRLDAGDRGRARGTGVILQCGMSSLPPAARRDVFECTRRHDLDHHQPPRRGVRRLDVHVLHPREELVEYARLLAEYGRAARVRDLEHRLDLEPRLADRAADLDPPYFTTLFFGWPGGAWSPPDRRGVRCTGGGTCRRTRSDGERHARATDRHHRRPRSTRAITCASAPRTTPRPRGTLAPTHELVAEVAEISTALGRELATSEQARAITGVRTLESIR